MLTAQRAQTPPRLHCLGQRDCVVGEKGGGAPCRVKIRRKKPDLRDVNGSGKMTLDPHPDPDVHQNSTTSSGSHSAHAYHVWSTSENAFVSHPAHRQNDNEQMAERMTDKFNSNNHIAP